MSLKTALAAYLVSGLIGCVALLFRKSHTNLQGLCVVKQSFLATGAMPIDRANNLSTAATSSEFSSCRGVCGDGRYKFKVRWWWWLSIAFGRQLWTSVTRRGDTLALGPRPPDRGRRWAWYLRCEGSLQHLAHKVKSLTIAICRWEFLFIDYALDTRGE